MKTLLITTSLILFGCGFQNEEKGHNAITSQQALTRKAIAEKYEMVQSINESDIIGKWKLIASFMTVEMPTGERGNTILLDQERLYDIRTNGVYHIDNETSHKWKWELTDNKTTFFNWGDEIDPDNEIEDYDQWKIRIAKDTMEWIQKVDDEFLYEVLVKVK